jgi:hypothetical protein
MNTHIARGQLANTPPENAVGIGKTELKPKIARLGGT